MRKTRYSLRRWTCQSLHGSADHASFKGTLDFGLLYSPSKEIKLLGYYDKDWAGDMDDRKSTTGFVFYMGDTTFTWTSKK